jgi:hypothetical protein
MLQTRQHVKNAAKITAPRNNTPTFTKPTQVFNADVDLPVLPTSLNAFDFPILLLQSILSADA